MMKILNSKSLPLFKKGMITSVLGCLLAMACSKDDDTGGNQTDPDPIIITINTFAESIAENPTSGQIVGTVSASLSTSGSLQYALVSQSINGALAINSSTGEITVADEAIFDFETNTEVTGSFSASFNSVSESANFTVTITNVNEAIALENMTVEVDENGSDTDVLVSFPKQDDEGETLTYSIATDTSQRFEITTEGELSLVTGASLDFEEQNSYVVVIGATDGENNITGNVTINVKDINDAPVFDSASLSAQAGENITDSQIITTLTATDEDTGDTLTFSTAQNGLFGVAANGEVSLANGVGLDYETETSHTLTVSVSDGEETISAQLTISVLDQNDAPLITNNTLTASAAEDVDDASTLYTVTGSDSNGDTLTFSIEQDNSGLFEINATSGEVSLVTGSNLDFETTTGHTITVGVADAEFTATSTITINVTNVTGVFVSTVKDNIGFVSDIVVDSNGKLYVTDFVNSVIRKVEPDGSFIVLAGAGSPGNVDGLGNSARFNSPRGLCIDNSDNLYVADVFNHSIRKITPDGTVTTIAGNGNAGFINANGTNAAFDNPQGVAIDIQGNLYVGDRDNNTIRKIDTNGNVTTLTTSPILLPNDLVYTSTGDLIIAQRANDIGEVDTTNGAVNIVAGTTTQGDMDGDASTASFNLPQDVVVDASGNIYVADTNNHKIRRISPAGVVTTLAGNGSIGLTNGAGINARFSQPSGLFIAPNGDIFVADLGNKAIRKIVIEP